MQATAQRNKLHFSIIQISFYSIMQI